MAEEKREKIVELLYDVFSASCMEAASDGKKMFDHGYISAYENAQDFLLKEGIITDDQCFYT